MAVLVALLPLILQLLQDAPAEIETIEGLWKFATSKTEPTPEQQAQVDAALEAAHQAVQNG